MFSCVHVLVCVLVYVFVSSVNKSLYSLKLRIDLAFAGSFLSCLLTTVAWLADDLLDAIATLAILVRSSISSLCDAQSHAGSELFPNGSESIRTQ